jgi:hypothetical protein
LTNIEKYIDETTNHYDYVLPINGEDIMLHLGIEPSKRVRDILGRLLATSFEKPDLTKEECYDLLDKFEL